MEKLGHKYIQKLFQFATTLNSTEIYSMDLFAENVKIFDCLLFL